MADTVVQLAYEDFANLFNITDKKSEFYYYNINKSIYIKDFENMSPSFFTTYEVQVGDTWTNISYKLYGTHELWWLVCKTNGIINPTEHPKQDQILKILSQDMATIILQQITNE